MATFSPDTTVKETVNVNYHDRITGQKVVMINRENEFYGTFKGVSELSGSTFVDPTIEGGTLHGTKIVDDDGKALNLSEYAQAIYDLEQADDDIRSEFADADIALYNRIKAESGESSGGAAKEACDALSVELVGKMELADEALKSQIETHETLSEEKFTSVENRLTESSARIDIVDGKAEENKASITELENAIRDIKTESAGGLIYRGSVNIEADTETFGDMIESLEGSGEVKTGYMYSVRAEADAPEKIEDKKVGSGDMIILKNITGTKTASSIRKLNVEIIDAMDKNILQRVDNALTRMEEIEAAIGGIGGFATKEEVNTVRAGLQTTYQSLHDEIGSVNSTLNTSIDNVNDRISGIDARIDNTHDELQTKVDEAAIISEANERREADNDIRASITGFQSAVDALNDRVDTVQSGLENVETGLEDETTRAKSVESSLNGQIYSEEARAKTAETYLESRIDDCIERVHAETDRALAVETDLVSRIDYCNIQINNEVARAETKEEELKNAIDDEKTRAKVAEEELESLITAEQTARGNGDIDLGNRMTDMYSDLTGYIDEEALSRKTADEELDAKFDLALTQEIEDRQNGDLEIKHDLIGSMKYVGHITLSCDDSGTPTQTLREMFHDYLENSLKVDPDTYPLKNGWIYQVTIDTELSGQSLATLHIGDGTGDSFEIWDRDYIVIHKRENMVDLTSNYDPSVLWNELSRENIDIIDAMDDNVVVEEQLSAIVSEINIQLNNIAGVRDELPYALVTPGEWAFSGLPNGVSAVMQYTVDNYWEIRLSNGDHQKNTVAAGENAISVEFPVSEWMEGTATYSVTATRASLPGHLLDRAVNTVSVDDATTFAFPEEIQNKSRDFYLNMSVSGSQTVTFPPTSKITYTGLGNPTGTYSEEKYLIRFTEISSNVFKVTNELASTGSYNDLLDKPTIPAEVTVVPPSPSAQTGHAADAKATGDALYSGFTPWKIYRNGVDVTALVDGQPTYSGGEWDVEFCSVSGDDTIHGTGVSDANVLSLEWDNAGTAYSATRHLITPTKTSQLLNDGPSSGPNVGHPFATTNDFKFYEKERYTAYEVMPTKLVIPAGTDLTANVDLGDGVISSLIDVTRCEGDYNLGELTTMQLPTDIPAGMTETFQLRCIPAYIEDTKALNVWVSWGDGVVTNISDDGVVTSDSPRTDASGIGYTLAHFTHTYTKPGKYIIEVHGKGYYGFFRYKSLTTNDTVDTLMSRVLDYDLPLSHDLTNFTNLALKAMRLIYVRLPSHVNWLEGVQNANKGFANCTNLIVAKGFFNLLWHARLSMFFSGCTNLKYCDLRLNGYPTYKNKVGDGNVSVFENCENLEGDIAQFLPVEGFASRVVNVDKCFYHCKKLGFDSLSCGANAGKNNEIWAGTATTPKILWGDTAKLWKSANVFGNNTTDILSGMPNLSGYVDLIPVSWGGRKPNNMAIDTAASEVLAEIADYEVDPSGYTMDDFVGLLSSFMDKIS